MALTVEWVNFQHITNMQRAMLQLGAGGTLRIVALAFNQACDKATTQIKRDLVIQTGLSASDVNSAITVKRAAFDLTYTVKGAGPFFSLSHFKPRSVQPLGVVARPWFQGRLFPKTFIIKAFGNNVYKRTGKGRMDIEKLYGPSVGREMEREPIPENWHKLVQTTVGPAIERKLAQFMPF